MNIEQYLTSPQAVADVAALLTRWSSPEWAEGETPWQRMTGVDGGIAVGTSGAWRWIEARMMFQAPDPRVYFRPHDQPFEVYQLGGNVMSPQIYLVNDLGEAVRALRLRTGDLTHPAQMARVPWRISDVLACLGALDFKWKGDALAVRCADADLPRAICAVMLAAHRVASLPGASR